jgi:hypothetical protein
MEGLWVGISLAVLIGYIVVARWVLPRFGIQS